MTDPSGDAFPSGVGSSDPTTSSIVIWTETARTGALTWEIGTTGFEATIARGRLDSASGPCSIRVDDLPPGTTFNYRFRSGAETSPVGTASTLPVQAERIRLGVACCSRLPTRDFAAYSALAAAAPDMVVHLGDYIYEDGDEPHEPPHTCRTEDDYDRRYRQYRHDPHLRTLHAAAPWVTLWDDHEVADDAWRRGSADDPAGEDWPERRRDALAAHRRWLPGDPDAQGPTPLERRLRLGDLADIVLLDARHGGRSAPVRRSGGPALVGPGTDRTILGEEQWDWLASIAAECRGWLIVATQVQVAPLQLARLPDPRRRFRPTPLVNPGQWDGYPRERRRLADVLAPVRGRVLVLSGDLHGRFVTRTVGDGGGDPERYDGAGSSAEFSIPEMTTPSVASPPFALAVRRRVPIPAPVLTRWLDLINPHVDHLDLEGHGTTLVDVTPERIVLTALSPDGERTGRWQLRRGAGRVDAG